MQARPSIEKGNIEEIMDANLLFLSEPCNMKVMLNAGQLALRCVTQEPKHRPTMTQVYKELELALYSNASFSNKEHSKGSLGSTGSPQQQSVESNYECSQSFVSINGVGFQKFYMDMDSFSFQSTKLMCLENNSISIDIDKNSLRKIQENETV